MLKRIVIGGLVATVACFNADAADLAAVWSLNRSPLCADLTNELDCALSIERAQLPKYPEVAWRPADTLFAVTGHSTYKFIDIGPEIEGSYDPGARYTSFLHYFSQLSLILIHQISAEDSHVLLIDAETGNTVALPDCPRMGPNGYFLVATNYVLGHNELQIWRLRPFRTELATGSHLWRFPKAVWRDDDFSIEVTRP